MKVAAYPVNLETLTATYDASLVGAVCSIMERLLRKWEVPNHTHSAKPMLYQLRDVWSVEKMTDVLELLMSLIDKIHIWHSPDLPLTYQAERQQH